MLDERGAELERVLIATRGPTAHRLVRFFKGLGVETVLVFGMAESEQELLDEADYASYVPGDSWEDVWLSPERILSVAMDAGCVAIHPGSCFLAEHVPFHMNALTANVLVFGPPIQVLQHVRRREHVQKLARSIGLNVVPHSDVLAEEDDGLEWAGRLGLPLVVRGVNGRAYELVSDYGELAAAVGRVRQESSLRAGCAEVYLARCVPAARFVSTVVVGDTAGEIVELGWCDSTLELGRFAHVEECGATLLASEVRQRLADQARALCKELEWVGVGRVRWLLTPDGEAFLMGISARLPTGFDLVEQVHGVDLIRAQYDVALGRKLHWIQPSGKGLGHGIQVRLYHAAVMGGGPAEGTLERLELPDDCHVERGVDDGTVFGNDTEPLLARITVVESDRDSAIRAIRQALEGVSVSGIPTNLEVLRGAFESEAFTGATHGPDLMERLTVDPQKQDG